MVTLYFSTIISVVTSTIFSSGKFFIVSVNSMISADSFKETTKLSYRSDD